ncbi:MAG: hypothetical protein ABNH00_06150 [Dokdonia sp.]|jgi:hypothetical protein
MNLLRTFFFGVLCVATLSCSDDQGQTTPDMTSSYLFADGFETSSNQISELFPPDNSRWTSLQQTNPTQEVNSISITSAQVSEGEDALQIIAYPSDTQLSKMDIEKGGLNLRSGDHITITADFFIEDTTALTNLLLLDLECCSCWDPEVGDDYGAEIQCPGVRLIMSGENAFLSIERGKIGASTITQSAIGFPRDQWVKVQWEMTLANDMSGQNKLFIDDALVINENGMNMPNPAIFSTIFAQEGIPFTLQEPVFYERVQIGATANPSAAQITMRIDNFSIEVE